MARTVTGTGTQAGAGWYVDPDGPPNQLRWWDGQRWTDATQVLSPWPTNAEPTRPRRRTIAWGALGAFLLAAGGATYAIARGQDVCEISATGLTFCDDGGGDTAQIDQGQDELGAQAEQYLEQASEQGVDVPRIDAVELSGQWDGDNGFAYVIEQFGDQATITELTPDGLVSATGAGTIDGTTFTFEYTAADLSVGAGVLEQVDRDQLDGSFQNLATGATVPITMTR